MSLLVWNPDLEGIREDGRSFGYPECCIDAFVADIEARRFPGELRGIDSTGRYVPCVRCLQNERV